MSEHTPYQKKIIERYYDHRDQIMLARLGEIVSELALADSEAKINRLWTRAEKAIKALNIPSDVVNRILSERKPDLLARYLREWLGSSAKHK